MAKYANKFESEVISSLLNVLESFDEKHKNSNLAKYFVDQAISENVDLSKVSKATKQKMMFLKIGFHLDKNCVDYAIKHADELSKVKSTIENAYRKVSINSPTPRMCNSTSRFS